MTDEPAGLCVGELYIGVPEQNFKADLSSSLPECKTLALSPN
jgi:hypothetical protein